MASESKEISSHPIVSVVICSYNRENTISAAIDSVLSQKCDFRYEIIIGDDGSTDNSREILRAYQLKCPDKIVLLFHETNQGLGSNWALCVKAAQGKYIASLDDDDFWCDNLKLQMQVDFLEKNPDYGLVHTNYYNFPDNRPERKKIANPEIQEEPNNLISQVFDGKYTINPNTVCLNKALLIPYIDAYVVNKFPIQDWPTWLILAKYSKFKYFDIPTVMYRRLEGNMSNPTQYNRIEKKYILEKKMYMYLCNLFPEDLMCDEIWYDNYVKAILLNLAYKKLDFHSAKRYASDIDSKSVKVFSAKNRLSFYFYGILKKIRGLIS